MSKIYEEIQATKADVEDIKKRVINIENDHGKKLDLLSDGYKQSSDQLNRIEKEVSYEEIILRRIK